MLVATGGRDRGGAGWRMRVGMRVARWVARWWWVWGYGWGIWGVGRGWEIGGEGEGEGLVKEGMMWIIDPIFTVSYFCCTWHIRCIRLTIFAIINDALYIFFTTLQSIRCNKIDLPPKYIFKRIKCSTGSLNSWLWVCDDYSVKQKYHPS